MHPFHSDDYFRYTPIGLRLLIDRAGLNFERLESPLWIFSVSAQMVVVVLRQLHLGFLERIVERTGYALDRVFRRFRSADAGFAAFYLVVARRSDGPLPTDKQFGVALDARNCVGGGCRTALLVGKLREDKDHRGSPRSGRRLPRQGAGLRMRYGR